MIEDRRVKIDILAIINALYFYNIIMKKPAFYLNPYKLKR